MFLLFLINMLRKRRLEIFVGIKAFPFGNYIFFLTSPTVLNISIFVRCSRRWNLLCVALAWSTLSFREFGLSCLLFWNRRAFISSWLCVIAAISDELMEIFSLASPCYNTILSCLVWERFPSEQNIYSISRYRVFDFISFRNKINSLILCCLNKSHFLFNAFAGCGCVCRCSSVCRFIIIYRERICLNVCFQ